jgi:hypothetical protein
MALYSRKALYYLLIAASEEEETQKKGMVAIIVNIGKNRAPVISEPPRDRKRHALISSLPCRFCALHFCVDDPATSTAKISMLMFALGSRGIRARFRMHKGELCEC